VSAPDAALAERFRADCLALMANAPTPDAPLALAVSGGPDSMALLVLAHAAFPGVVTVATVDHQLRTDSADEAAMVTRYCRELGAPHTTLAPDAPITGASLQAQARAARYALLVEWAHGAGATALATAHQADDQAETFLMRAARGAGLAGLAGIRASRPEGEIQLVRPLLEWRRAELRAIVRRAEAPFVDDPANLDPRHDRTRFRRLLEANEWLDAPSIARAAAHLAEVESEIEATLDALWDTRVRAAPEGECAIDVAGLPRELRRRLARRAIGAVREETGIERPAWSDASNVESLLDALGTGHRVTLAGIQGTPKGEIWRFRAAPPRRSH
jgi:tRNA(Ile)-lysidine synthase